MVSIARGRRAPLMPSEVWAFVTAFSAYSICTSLPEGLNVVSEYEYADSPMPLAAAARQRWAPPRPQLDIAGNTLRPTARQRARVALLPGAPPVCWLGVGCCALCVVRVGVFLCVPGELGIEAP